MQSEFRRLNSSFTWDTVIFWGDTLADNPSAAHPPPIRRPSDLPADIDLHLQITTRLLEHPPHLHRQRHPYQAPHVTVADGAELGENLKLARMRRCLSAEQVAKRAGNGKEPVREWLLKLTTDEPRKRNEPQINADGH